MKIKYLKAFLPSLALVLFTACNSDNDTTTPGIEDPAPTAIIHNGTTYGTVTSPQTGKVWLDRNLGAVQICTALDDTACYGDYYQWGRNFDGHQDSTSGTTAAQATDINNAESDFITSTSTYEYDWATHVDHDGYWRGLNWKAADGSSVCPSGFRVPSMSEIEAETYDVTDNVTAFKNFLKLPSAGGRDYDGQMKNDGSVGIFWSSSAIDTAVYFLVFESGVAFTGGGGRAGGFFVRCIKNQNQLTSGSLLLS